MFSGQTCGKEGEREREREGGRERLKSPQLPSTSLPENQKEQISPKGGKSSKILESNTLAGRKQQTKIIVCHIKLLSFEGILVVPMWDS
jgi:hypothetical protein